MHLGRSPPPPDPPLRPFVPCFPPFQVYFPPDTVRDGALTPSTHVSVCAAKGVATYYNVVARGVVAAAAAWAYRTPLPGGPAAAVAEHIAFRAGVAVVRTPWLMRLVRAVRGWCASRGARERGWSRGRISNAAHSTTGGGAGDEDVAAAPRVGT